MKYIINKLLGFGVVMVNILTGGGNVAYSANQGVYRGNFAVIEVDEDSPMTAIPNTGTWYNGPLDTNPQQYDVLVAARGNIDTRRTEVNLTVTPAKTPDFFTTQDGKIVVAEPQIFGTVTIPMGHDLLVEVLLLSVNSAESRHVCVGIRKQGETEFFDVVHTGNEYSKVDVFTGGDVLEFIPLLSKTDVTDKYTAVKPGDPVEFDFTLGSKFDFGSVFRIDILDVRSRYGTNWSGAECDMPGEFDEKDMWLNGGSLGVGKIPGYDGDRLLAISVKGKLMHSGDGIHWIRMGNIGYPEGQFAVAPKYGNGTWCAVSRQTGIIRLGPDGIWSALSDNPCSEGEAFAIAFGNGKFMIWCVNGDIFTSQDTINWKKINNIGETGTTLAYGNGKWLAIDFNGHLFLLEDGEEVWEPIYDAKVDGENFHSITTTLKMCGLCYAKGYFYLSSTTNLSNKGMRSLDGKNWSTVDICSTGLNISYFKGKLYTLHEGTEEPLSYSVGILPQP